MLPSRSQLAQSRTAGAFWWMTGIEDTFITAPHPATGRTLDEYELTGHYERCAADIDLLASLGVSAARYGVTLDASLITGIDPPPDVESALAAINTAHNQVSSDISLAQAAADQKIVQSKRAVEIETLKAQAEVEPLDRLATQLTDLKKAGGDKALMAYTRNVRLALFEQAQQVFVEDKP